jgi:hypothetical protein
MAEGDRLDAAPAEQVAGAPHAEAAVEHEACETKIEMAGAANAQSQHLCKLIPAHTELDNTGEDQVNLKCIILVSAMLCFANTAHAQTATPMTHAERCAANAARVADFFKSAASRASAAISNASKVKSEENDEESLTSLK